MAPTIRLRRPDDVPALVEVLGEQQAASRYPERWPLPFPTEQFVVRSRERVAWVAELDGAPVGHVSVQRAAGETGPDGAPLDPVVRLWAAAHERPVPDLAVVSALFTSSALRGTGLGGRLLDHAVGWVREEGLAPCLDVVPGPSPALAIYRRRGWQVAGEARPDWVAEWMPDVVAMVLR